MDMIAMQVSVAVHMVILTRFSIGDMIVFTASASSAHIFLIFNNLLVLIAQYPLI